MEKLGHALAQLVEALPYKPEGRGFDFYILYILYLLTAIGLSPGGNTQIHTNNTWNNTNKNT
jgi:hypothetical protein